MLVSVLLSLIFVLSFFWLMITFFGSLISFLEATQFRGRLICFVFCVERLLLFVLIYSFFITFMQGGIRS